MSNNEDGLQRWTNTTIDVLKHQKAICLLVAGHSLEETCKELGIAKRTLQRWFSYPEFNQNLGRAIKHIYAASFAKATIYVDKSLDILMKTIEDIDTPIKYRLVAIEILLNFTSKGLSIVQTQQQPEVAQKLNYQSHLFRLHDGAKLAAKEMDESVAQRVAFDNSRAIWAELYPNEAYPE